MLTNLAAFTPGAPLHAMTFYKQWLLYQRGEFNHKKQKYEKTPIQANGYGMPWRSEPHKLMTFADAVSALSRRPDCSLGFVLTEVDDFFCVDIDHCKTPDGQWSDVALDLVARVPNGVVEVSMGGDGLHIWGTAADLLHACDNDSIGTEFYTKHRAMAVSGNVLMGSDIAIDSTTDVADLVATFFLREVRDIRRDGSGATLDDLVKARAAVQFIDPDLNYNDWLGNCMALHAAGVEADAENTAFEIAQEYTELSPKCVPGYLEQKWHSFHADGGLTLGTLFHHAKAGGYKTREEIDAAAAFAAHKATVPPPPPPPPPGVKSELFVVEVEEHTQGIRYPTDYLPMFGACVYIAALHCIWTPDGLLLDQKRFDALYSGHQYALDQEGRKCVDSPWEAFFKCRVYKFRRVNRSCFRPDLPTGSIVTAEGRSALNTYYPLAVDRRKGDVTPFLNHLTKLIPDARDQQILLSYLAALVQNPGKKFQWAPLLQGVEGNGKTFFTHCAEQAIGLSYSHYPNAQDLNSKFNHWMANRLLICVEDIYVPGYKADLIEALKPMITGKRLEIQGKGADQTTQTVCANFIFNSNHRTALGSAVKGRRYCVFYTRQQDEQDIIRDGMDGRYFLDLYSWAEREGFAYVTEFLHTYPIADEFNPAGVCTRAPKTSSHSEVMSEALGPVEQEIMAAISDERPGFVLPWISSQAVDRLLKDIRKDDKVPRNKRRGLIESLGYVRHPHLPDGRTNNAVLPDAARTTLFVKRGNPALELQAPAAIAEAYSKKQMLNTLQAAVGVSGEAK